MAAQRSRAAAELAEVPGIGPKRAALLAAQGVRSRAELVDAPGLPFETRLFLRYGICRAIPAETGEAVLAELRRRLVFRSGVRHQALVVGSARRERPVFKDLDLLAVVPTAQALPGFLASAALSPPKPGDRASVAAEFSSGDRRRTLVVSWRGKGGGNYAVDLFAATLAERPYALYHLTGSHDYNVRSRMAAKRRGWRLNQYGLWCGESDRRVPGSEKIRTEADLARFLGLTPRPPRARER